MTVSSNNAVREVWESAAPGWAKWEDILSQNLVSATKIMFDMANISPGMKVLDLACGAGSQTLMVADLVGAQGKVVACDISEKMLKHVRDNAAKAGLNNVKTLRRAAEDLKKTDGPFDAAICRTGLMLFGSPADALVAVKNTLRPGACFSAMVFSAPQSNPFVAQPMSIALRHSGKHPPIPGAPGIFALANEGVLRSHFREMRYRDIKTKIVRVPLHLVSAAEALAMMQEAFGAFRAVLADLEEDARARAWDEIGSFLEQFETQSGLKSELEFLIASGVNPTESSG